MAGDTLRTNPELVKALVTNGPLMIKWLEDLDVLFNKTGSSDTVGMWGWRSHR